MLRVPLLIFSLTIASHGASVEPPKELTNSIGMEFKLIPAGEFAMGSAAGEKQIAMAASIRTERPPKGRT